MTHGITAEEYARVIAKVHEPDLDWDKPGEYDLLDRTTLIESAEKTLAQLSWAGFVVERLDDLVLDEFDRPAPTTPGHADGIRLPRGADRAIADALATMADEQLRSAGSSTACGARACTGCRTCGCPPLDIDAGC